jgi:hypothetical protein
MVCVEQAERQRVHMEPELGGLYSKAQVARALNVSMRTLDNWLADSNISVGKDKGDKRRLALTYEQVEKLATDHNREIQLFVLEQEFDDGPNPIWRRIVNRVLRLEDRQRAVEREVNDLRELASSLNTITTELSRHLSTHDNDIQFMLRENRTVMMALVEAYDMLRHAREQVPQEQVPQSPLLR